MRKAVARAATINEVPLVSDVNVLFFASLREDIGIDKMSVQAGSIAELLRALDATIGSEKLEILKGENVRIAVNQSLLSGECELRDGDEIAFLPPVTGG